MKPTLPKGTRDFLPHEARCRHFIFQVMRDVFELYDFQPIETPAVEKLATLTGKYGEEGDKLLFKILNNGDFLKKTDKAALSTADSQAVLPSISSKGLRYDLTVPLARYVVMNQNDIKFPFKRYQIQPVWRADRPQRGRYREFYQCDVDILGSDAIMYEAELTQIYDEVFHRLKIPVTIHINSRKILHGIAEAAGVGDVFSQFAIILDKLDKIGKEKVADQFKSIGLNQENIQLIFDLLNTPDIDALANKINKSDTGLKGIEEIKNIQKYLSSITLHNNIQYTWSLARGLDYYTGCIFEVTCPKVNIGSIGGGGRYDDLTGIFGMKGVSGVGVSFGAARIYDVMKELGLFSDRVTSNAKLLLMAMDTSSHHYAFECADRLRAVGIPVSVYPTPGKLKKPMKYANDRNFLYTGVLGASEVEGNYLTIKDMKSGDQQQYSISKAIEMLSKS